MAAKATIRPGYRWRLGIISLAMLAFGGWFIYDGLVAYPRQQTVHETYERIRAENEQDWQTVWVAEAQANGWPQDPPKPVSDLDIIIQLVCAGITLPLGIIFGLSFVRAGGRWLATDEQGLHTSWGQHATWDAIREIDKTRWKTKGIAVVRYDDGGTTRKITLDDWKYDREPVGAMLAEVEAHHAPEQATRSEDAATGKNPSNASA